VQRHWNLNKYASYPDWHISPHANRQSQRNTNSLQHWPSPTMPVSHTTHGPRLSSKFVTLGKQPSNVLSIFHFLAQGANLWAKVHQRGGDLVAALCQPTQKISSPYVNQRPRYPLPKILQTKKWKNEKQQTIYPRHAYQNVGIKITKQRVTRSSWCNRLRVKMTLTCALLRPWSRSRVTSEWRSNSLWARRTSASACHTATSLTLVFTQPTPFKTLTWLHMVC